MTWIRVDNILPPIGLKVLTINNYGWYKIDRLTPDSLWESVGALTKFLGMKDLMPDTVMEITHWTYLPDKPE